MKICTRHFIIPESPDEIALCMNTKNLHMLSVNYKGRSFSIWTEEDDNDGLLNEYLSKIDSKYYFEAMVLTNDLTPSSIAEFLVYKSRPEVLIDIRENPTIGFNLDKVKIHVDKLLGKNSTLHYRWMPKLDQPNSFNDGIYEIRTLLRTYRRLTFIGTKPKKLNKICKLLEKETKLITL